MSKYTDALRKIDQNRSKNSPYPFSQLNLDPPQPESKFKKVAFVTLIVFLILASLVYALGLYLERRGVGSHARPASSMNAPATQPLEISSEEISFNQLREFLRYAGVWTLPDIPPASSSPAQPDAAAVSPAAPVAETKAVVDPKKSGSFYTLQLVSYRTPARAKQEVETLSKKGYDAFVVQANKFYVVCTNRFETRALAAKKLTEVKGTIYRDAFVRTIKQ